MGRIEMVIGLTVFFLGWVVYRLIKGDLMEHKSTLYVGLLFIAVWVVLYFLLMR